MHLDVFTKSTAVEYCVYELSQTPSVKERPCPWLYIPHENPSFALRPSTSKFIIALESSFSEIDGIRGTPEDLRAVGADPMVGGVAELGGADAVAHIAVVFVVVVRNAAADEPVRGGVDAVASVLVDSYIEKWIVSVS